MSTTNNLVRTSCLAFLEHCTDVAVIDDGAIEAMVADGTLPYPALTTFHFGDTNDFSELKFESLEDEVGFICLAHAVDFGSGFRHALHKHRNGQGAWLTIRAGLIALGQHMGPTVVGERLAALELDDVVRLFDLGAEPLVPLAQQLHNVFREIGGGVVAAGHRTLGQLVSAIVAATPTALGLTAALVAHFPLTFRDEYTVRAQYVALHKKAQLVVGEIFVRCKTEPSATLFHFADYADLTAFADNVVVATLRKTGVIRVPDELAAKIEAGVPVLKGSVEEVAMRAAAVVAVDRLVGAYNAKHASSVTAATVCTYLWGCLGKRPDFRKYQRHHTPDTWFY